MQGTAPLDLVRDCPAFLDQGGVDEELFSQSRLDMTNGFPVGWAEVSAKYLEEQIVGKDVGESACHVWMVLDLSEVGLDVIGMNNDVVIGVQDLEVVCLDEDFLMH